MLSFFWPQFRNLLMMLTAAKSAQINAPNHELMTYNIIGDFFILNLIYPVRQCNLKVGFSSAFYTL